MPPRDEPRGAGAREAKTSAREVLAELARLGANVRLGRSGQLLIQGASRVPDELRARVRRHRDLLVEALLARERWARDVTDRERS